MTFHWNETYFLEKFPVWIYLTSKLSKIAQIEVFRHFLDFASLVFLDFAHNDGLQFASPVSVFLFEILKVMLSCSGIIKD